MPLVDLERVTHISAFMNQQTRTDALLLIIFTAPEIQGVGQEKVMWNVDLTCPKLIIANRKGSGHLSPAYRDDFTPLLSSRPSIHVPIPAHSQQVTPPTLLKGLKL